MKNRSDQAGYSLVEMMVVAAVLLIVMFGAIGIMVRATNSASISAEKNQLEQSRELLGNLIRPDFEKAGVNLASFSNHSFGQLPANFISNNDYAAGPGGEITKINPDATNAIESTTQIASATGAVLAMINGEGYVRLTGRNGGELILSVQRIAGLGYQLSCQIGGQTTPLGNHQPGSNYRIGLTPDAAGKAVVITRFNPVQQVDSDVELMREANNNLPEGAITISAYIEDTNDHMQILLRGSPLVLAGPAQLRQTPLFYDQNAEVIVNDFIYFNSLDSSLNLISGDLKAGMRYLREPAANISENSTLVVTKNEKASLRANDYCLLIDYNRNSSALLKVTGTSNIDATSQQINFTPVTLTEPAWNRFSATAESLQGTYETGSRLIKLAEPIVYRISADDNRLIRQTGTRAETVAFNVLNLEYVPASDPDGVHYQIKLQMTADGRHTDREGIVPTVNYVYTATPRALNAANQFE